MTTKSDVLRIRLETDGDGNVKASIAGVGNALGKTGRVADEAQDKVLSLKKVLVSLASAAVVRGAVQTIVEFERLGASLKTVTGSAEAATEVFDELKNFAATTPYQLQNVVEAFIKLKALGLDPSMEALRSYGNTAAAMGKDINQFIEAVADAATGEFERLKEFGIKASSQGNEVAFTFQGVTTHINKNANEISAYLQSIGNTQFAGAMEEQMGTLGGVFSNLQDSAAQLAAAIGEAGLSSGLKSVSGIFRDLSTAITTTINPTESAIKQAKELNPAYKILAFTLFKLKQEFVDIGGLLSSWGDVLNLKVGPGFFARYDAIVQEAKLRREKLEKETEEYVASLEGIDIGQVKKSPLPPPTKPEVATTTDGLIVKGDLDIDKFLLDLENKENALRQSLLTQQQLEEEAYEERKRMLDQFIQYGVNTDITQEQLRQQHEDRMKEIAGKNANEWADIWTSAGNRFAAGIGDATASAIIDQQNITDSAQALLQGAVRQTLSSLVEIGIKKVALWAIDKIGIASNTAAAVASGATISAAMATPAALASLATLGANAVPAAAGITSTVALSKGLALAGQAHDGMDYVPREGSYILDQGEMVLDKGTSDFVRNSVIPREQDQNINFTFNVNTIDAKGFKEMLRGQQGIIGALAATAINDLRLSRGQRGIV